MKKIGVSAILVILVIGALTGLAYSAQNESISNSLRMGLESTASVMATQINASDLAAIKPGDETTPQYQSVVSHLKTMRSMDDHIVNAYIMKVNPDQSITFLVDDLYPEDPQGSAKIGDIYIPPYKMVILAALSAPESTNEPYTDQYGTFISAYAPIDDSTSDSAGNTYAVLGIDVSARDYANYMQGKGNLILITGLVSILISLGVIAYFGSRLLKDGTDCTAERK
jgi:methyl-accepting chemotaxis protein